MGRSSHEKIEYAKKLVGDGLLYQEIQKKLKDRYGSGMSNTTLKRMRENKSKIEDHSKRIGQLESQLTVFKKFYFELKEKMEKMEKEEKEENSHSLENLKDNREEEDGNES